MPIYDPMTVSGVVYDLDGTTKMTSGDVIIENFTKGTRLVAVINSVGEYTGDLASLSTGWAVNDVICLTVTSIAFKGGEVYYKINTGDTVIEADIYLKNSTAYKARCRLYAVSFSSDAARSLHLMDRANNTVRARVNVAADATATVTFGGDGIYFDDGIRQIITATDVDMTSPGTGTLRGDTATNVGNSVTLLVREV